MERFSLRLLLNHINGAQSYDHLKFFENKQYLSFQSAAIARGLLEDAQEAIKCIEEAYNILCNPDQFRAFFCQYLINCSPDTATLWEVFKDRLAEDILFNQKLIQNNINLNYNNDIYNFCILKIKTQLEFEGSHLSYFPELPQLTDLQIHNLNTRYANPIITLNQDMIDNANNIYNTNYPTLNQQQKLSFDTIVRENNSIG